MAQTLKDSLSKTMSSVSAHRQHRERLGLVVRELNHRVRNILALVGSMVSQSKGSATDLESFILTLEHRIRALSDTHKLLTEFDWDPISIKLLFERALAPYSSFIATRILLVGDDVLLPPELASLLTLVMHELASNASKYGALSESEGSITPQWQVDHECLTVDWRESDGKSVTPPTCEGFGTSLIKDALAYEFDAECGLEFLPSGVHAHFVIPHRSSKVKPPSDISVGQEKPVGVSPFTVLLLEDDYIIAKETKAMLEGVGAARVDAAPSLEKAKDFIANNTYDFALLDANIRGEFSVEVAEQLQRKGVPFVYATGYGSKDRELRSTACIDVLSKPIDDCQLVEVLRIAGVI